MNSVLNVDHSTSQITSAWALQTWSGHRLLVVSSSQCIWRPIWVVPCDSASGRTLMQMKGKGLPRTILAYKE